MDKLKKFEQDITKISSRERKAVRKALDAARQFRDKDAAEALAFSVADIVAASARTARKRKSDKRTDEARRVLIGARVPRESADRYRMACGVTARSMYRFVMDALEAEYRRVCLAVSSDAEIEENPFSPGP